MYKPSKKADEANRLMKKGYHYLRQNRPKKALRELNKLEKIIRRHFPNDRSIAAVLTDKACAYLLANNPPQSIRLLEKSLRIKRRIGDEKFTLTTLMNLAKGYRTNCDYDESLSVLDEIRQLARRWGDAGLTNEVEQEAVYTNHAKNKEPMLLMRDMQFGTEEGIFISAVDSEYIPNLFNELTARVECINVEIASRLEAKVLAEFAFEYGDNEITAPYETDKWKESRPASSQPRIEGSTPNFAIFYGSENDVVGGNIEIRNEEGHVVKCDSKEKCWNIFVPDSYPMGLFVKPMPICENFMFFNGTARLLYWKLDAKNKYKLKFTVQKQREGPFQFALLFPYRKLKISASNLIIKLKDSLGTSEAYLKRISYTKSRVPRIQLRKVADYGKQGVIHKFTGDEFLRLDKCEPTQTIETRDFELLFFDILLRSSPVKHELFPILKEGPVFRKEIGVKKYSQLVEEIRRIPEKCQQHTTGDMCRECSTKIQEICVVNLIGIICNSDILPHHGFEYSDLLITINTETKKIIPIIVKGSTKLTWGRDQGLMRQLVEKFSDEKIDTIVVASSGQIGNRLKSHLEHLSNVHRKSLVFLNERDLAQFLYKLKQLQG